MCAQVTEFRMKLSERMQAIADRVSPGETVADIGTDHGQIPVWLFARGICPQVILTDISEGSIAKAKETAAAYQFGHGLSFRVGDGLSVLKPGEADTVIIAGMGGKLIRQIMEENLDHTLSFRKFILQPRKGYGDLRRWLLENGFMFTHEDIVRESHFLPEIMTVVRPAAAGVSVADSVVDSAVEDASVVDIDPDDRTVSVDGNASRKEDSVIDLAADEREFLLKLPEDDIRIRVPRWILRASGPVEEYLQLRINLEQMKLDNMRRAKERNHATEQKVEGNIQYLEGLLQDAACYRK